MLSSLSSLALVASFVIIVSASPSRQSLPMGGPVSCGLAEYEEMPCVCCKKSCWYTIASAATHELGHMPGEAGEQEAMATLALIRACMITDCSEACRARPF